MSKESYEWLNTHTLIGLTDKRGNAWHYREELQGNESNHYHGPVPQADVLRRLFNFEVVSEPIYTNVSGSYKEVPNKQALVTSDTHDVLGVFTDGYRGHSYEQWLLQNVATILGDELVIAAAGLLKNRAVAWVEVSVPDNIETPSGVTFRPNLVACTSYDGSLATTYKRTVTHVVCDNTLAAGLSENGQIFKVRHSAHSLQRVDAARGALAIVHSTANAFQREIEKLVTSPVSDSQFLKWLDLYVPVPAISDSKRGHTTALNKREELVSLYRTDPRVTPWQGTEFGVLQTANTWFHHVRGVKGKDKGIDLDVLRGLRNTEDAIFGRTAEFDKNVLDLLAAVA